MEIVAGWFLFGLAAAAVARSRGRSGCAGLALGALLGPLGLIVALVMRRRLRAEPTRNTSPSPDDDGRFIPTGMIGPYPYRDEPDGRVAVMIQGGLSVFPSRKAAEKALSR